MYIPPPSYLGQSIYQTGYYQQAYQNPARPAYQQPVAPTQPNLYSQPYYPNTNPNPNVNNNTIYNKNQSITLDQALMQSSYPPEKREIISDMLLTEYIGNTEAKVYFQYRNHEKLFVVEYVLSINLMNKKYNVDVYMHIPITYPENPPEFFLGKKKGVCLNNEYTKNNIINGETFQVNLENICRYNPRKNNISEIINALKNSFNKTFPVYKGPTKIQYEIYGKNNLDKNVLQEVIIKSEKFTDTQLLNFLRKQVKNLVYNKYNDFNNKYKTPQYYKDLRQMKMEIDSSSNSGSSPMNQQIGRLNQIKEELYQIESGIRADVQNIENSNVLMKCDELIKVKNDKNLEFLVKKKIIEDYLVFLRKGYEKKLVSLEEMLEQTRTLSREIFTIDYLRKNMNYN